MKYYVIYTANGNLAINQITEFSSLDLAKAKFHDVCRLMWSDASTNSAFVAILDNQMNQVGDYYEGIVKAQAQE